MLLSKYSLEPSSHALQRIIERKIKFSQIKSMLKKLTLETVQLARRKKLKLFIQDMKTKIGIVVAIESNKLVLITVMILKNAKCHEDEMLVAV